MTYQKHKYKKWLKKGNIIIFSCVLALSLTIGGQSAKADSLWNHWSEGNKLAEQGNEAAAVPHWIIVVDILESQGEWNNAAIFAGKIAAYYDKTNDYEQAVKYYEKEATFWDKTGNDWGAPKRQRAEQLRTTVELYMSTSDTARFTERTKVGNKPLAKLEPEYGAYFGIYSEGDPKVGNRFNLNEQEFGKKPAMFLFYWPYGRDLPSSYFDQAKKANGGVQIAWEPSGGLQEVNDGAYLRKFVRDMKATGIPIFLRYASEMNGNWVKWNGNPQQYIEKFRLIYQVIQEEKADNVAMVWSPNDLPEAPIDSYYPGDDYVDWVGLSLYTSPYTIGDSGDKKLNIQSEPAQWLDKVYKTYASRKPIMLSETAISHEDHASAQTNEDFTEWAELNLQRLLETMPYKYPRLKAITYFNKDIPYVDGSGITRNNYMLNDAHNPALSSYVKGLLANPYLLSDIKQGAAPATNIGFVKVGEPYSTVKHRTTFAPYVKIPNVYIGKMEIAIDGHVYRTLSAPPYRFELDRDALSEESQIELTVYNKSGVKMASSKFDLSPEVLIEIDGVEQSYGQAPVIINGSTLTPLRAIFEALGAEVAYDGSTGTITAHKGDVTVSLAIGDKTAFVNGKTVELTAPAQLVRDRTMAPARFIGEAFGGKVTWDQGTHTVRIVTKP